MKRGFENKEHNQKIKTFVKIINGAYIRIYKCYNNRIRSKFKDNV